MAKYPLPTGRQWAKSWQTSEGIALFSRWNPKWVLPVQARSIAIWINFLGNVFRTDTYRHAYSFYALNANTKKYDFHNIWHKNVRIAFWILNIFWKNIKIHTEQNVTHFNNWFNQMLKTKTADQPKQNRWTK